MRKLTLDEKITIKGELARKRVLPRLLVRLDMLLAISLYWRCFGRPLYTVGLLTMWRKRRGTP